MSDYSGSHRRWIAYPDPQLDQGLPTAVINNDFNREAVSFVNPSGQTRKFPTVRFDFNPFKNHHIEEIWNYQQFRSETDNLNNVDPAFPDFPNFGSQDSNRFSNVTAWRWTIKPKHCQRGSIRTHRRNKLVLCTGKCRPVRKSRAAIICRLARHFRAAAV